MLPILDDARFFFLPVGGTAAAFVGILRLPNGRQLETRRVSTQGEALSELARAVAGRAPWRTHLDEAAAILTALGLNNSTPSMRAADWARLEHMVRDPGVSEAELQSTVHRLLTDFRDDAAARPGYMARAKNLMADPLAGALFARGPGGEALEPIGDMFLCGVRAAQLAFLNQALALGVVRPMPWDCMSAVTLDIGPPLRTPEGDTWATCMAARWVNDPEMRQVFLWLTIAGATLSPPITRADGRSSIYASLRAIFNPHVAPNPTSLVRLVPTTEQEITQAILQAA